MSGGVVIIIWNEWVIRFDLSVTHDANSAANRILDKEEFFAVGKQVYFLFSKFQHASNVKPGRV